MRASLHLLVLLLAFVHTVAQPLDAQQEKFLTCNLPPLDSSCRAVLPLKQDSLQLSVRVNLPRQADTSAAGASTLVLSSLSGHAITVNLAGAAADTPRVTISSTHCCVTPQVATVDRNGYVSLTWRGLARPDTTVELAFAAHDGHRLQMDTARITPELAPTRKNPLALFTTPYHRTVPRYVWVRGDHIPVTIPVAIDSVGTTVRAGLSDDSARALTMWRTREYCERVRVVFTALQGGKASPDSARAMWYPRREGMAWHPRDGRCVVETRWRLADDAGEQQMNVVVGDDSIVARTRFLVTAFGRQPPRLTGGYGYFGGLRQDRRVICAEARERSRCTNRGDTDTVTVQVRDGGGSAYFAVEFPLFLRYQVSEGAGVGKYFSEHVRIVIGSTFERPGDNIFLGLAVLPLLSGASEAAPFQLSAGVGSHGIRTWYVGMSLDASTIVTPVLTAIGAGK